MSGRLSVGIGLTNDCNLACSHCYRPRGAIRYLGLPEVASLLDAVPAGSVNLGTGENILNPALGEVLDDLHARAIPTSLTSNGLSLLELDDARLRRLHDVEVSIDFAEPAEMDAFRGPGAWDTAVRAVQRCIDAGLRVTVLAVLMRTNVDRLAAIARLAARLGATFRVNVYQPVHDDGLMPTWEEFWRGFGLLLRDTDLVTCTEPVVAAWLDAQAGRPIQDRPPCGCGRSSLRLTPSGELLPCVYWPRPAATLAELPGLGLGGLLETTEFRACRSVPAACSSCPLIARCGGGCASRRTLVGAPDQPDPYCPYRGAEPPRLCVRPGPDLDLLHAANVCTTIVRADS